MTGLVDCSTAAITSRSVGSSSGQGLPNMPMSAPAKAPTPPPRSTTAPNAPSAWASASACTIAPGMPTLIAFTGGLSMVITATAPSRSSLTPPHASCPSVFLWITGGNLVENL